MTLIFTENGLPEVIDELEVIFNKTECYHLIQIKELPL